MAASAHGRIVEVWAGNIAPSRAGYSEGGSAVLYEDGHRIARRHPGYYSDAFHRAEEIAAKNGLRVVGEKNVHSTSWRTPDNDLYFAAKRLEEARLDRATEARRGRRRANLRRE